MKEDKVMENKLTKFLGKHSMRPIAYYPVYASITGGRDCGIVLAQLIYWHYASNEQEFYKTDTKLAEEVNMPLRTLKRIKQKLIEKGFISISIKGTPRKTYYKVNIEKIMEAISEVVNSASKVPDWHEPEVSDWHAGSVWHHSKVPSWHETEVSDWHEPSANEAQTDGETTDWNRVKDSTNGANEARYRRIIHNTTKQDTNSENKEENKDNINNCLLNSKHVDKGTLSTCAVADGCNSSNSPSSREELVERKQPETKVQQSEEVQTQNEEEMKNTAPASSSEAPSEEQDKPSDKKEKIPPCPHQKIIDLYHEILPELPKVKAWNETRRRYLQARWREAKERQNLDWWRRFFKYIRESDFLMGRTIPSNGRPPFRATLEWILRPNNFAKIIEGFYHRKSVPISPVTAHNLMALKFFKERYLGKKDTTYENLFEEGDHASNW